MEQINLLFERKRFDPPPSPLGKWNAVEDLDTESNRKMIML